MNVNPPVIIEVMSQALRIALGSAYVVRLAPGYSSSGDWYPWSIDVYLAPNCRKHLCEIVYDAEDGIFTLYGREMTNFSISDPELVLKLMATIQAAEPTEDDVAIGETV